MSSEDPRWNTIRASALTQKDGLLRPTSASRRPHGGLRYRCPVAGSYVLVTDEPTLALLAHPPTRLRCADCGEEHLMTVEVDDPGDVAAAARKS